MSDGPETARSGLATRLILVGGVVAMGLVVLMMALVERSVRAVWLDDLDRDLEAIAAVAATGLDAVDPQPWAEAVAGATGTRVTLIRLDGVVVADSHQDPAAMENHAGRPEFAAALAGRLGTDTRVSASTGFDQRYVAVPPADGMVVRVSTSTAVIENELSRTRQAVATGGVMVAVVAILLLATLGNRLSRPVTRLADQAQAIAAGDLTTTPHRSPVAELDRLALALGDIVSDLGGRMAEAEQASATLEAVLGAIPQGTVLYDGGSEVVYANPAAQEMLGAVPPRLGALAPLQFQEAIREARTRGEAVVREIDHGVPARRLRATANLLGPEGRVLLVIVDITERVRVESIRRDFVANASHELKTPVASMVAAAEALQIALSRGDPNVDEFAGRIEGSARQLDRLVADLLDLSRLEQEMPELFPTRLDLVAAAEAERARDRVADNGLIFELSASPVIVMADERGLGTAVRNLIDNAIRHTPAGGRVSVTVAEEDGSAVLRIVDTGEGIPSADLGRVFERFYRVDAARSRDTGGTGLGLAIVRHVAETHGGSAAVQSELGAGSTFTLRLPVAPGHQRRLLPPLTRGEKPSPASPGASPADAGERTEAQTDN